PFVPRLSNRNHRYLNLGIRGPTAPTHSLNQTPRQKSISPTRYGGRVVEIAIQTLDIGAVIGSQESGASLPAPPPPPKRCVMFQVSPGARSGSLDQPLGPSRTR